MTARVLKAPSVVMEGDPNMTTSAFNEALKEAFQQGRASGRAEATAGLETEVSALREALVASAAVVRDAASESARLDIETIVNLAGDLTEWTLEGVVKADPAILADSLRSSLAVMVEEASVVLHVHPDMASALGEDQTLGVDAVRSDPTLGRGDFRLVSDGSMVERRWQDSIRELTPELVSAFHGPNKNA